MTDAQALAICFKADLGNLEYFHAKRGSTSI
jgi:hypothetical protein